MPIAEKGLADAVERVCRKRGLSVDKMSAQELLAWLSEPDMSNAVLAEVRPARPAYWVSSQHGKLHISEQEVDDPAYKWQPVFGAPQTDAWRAMKDSVVRVNNLCARNSKLDRLRMLGRAVEPYVAIILAGATALPAVEVSRRPVKAQPYVPEI